MSKWLFIIIGVLSFYSCKTEYAKAPTVPELNIASDILTSRDSLLFQSFENQHHCKVIITHLPLGYIMDKISASPFNHGFDLIISKSASRLGQLNYKSLLQEVEKDKIQCSDYFISTKYNFVTVGFNPFVLSTHKDSTINIRTYNELKSNHYQNKLSFEENIVMLSGVYSKLRKNDTYTWVIQSNQMQSDSAQYVKLSTYSIVDLENSKVIYPNQFGSGSFYDILAISMPIQPEDYQLSTEFINEITSSKMNSKICNDLQYLPLSDFNQYRLYKKKPDDLIQYYGVIKRILKSAKNQNIN